MSHNSLVCYIYFQHIYFELGTRIIHIKLTLNVFIIIKTDYSFLKQVFY